VIRQGPEALADVNALLNFQAGSKRSVVTSYPEDQIEFLPAVYPSKILAIGRNYADHALEGGGEPPKAPLIFAKLANALNAHNAPIVLPTVSETIDWEAELAVVIGRRVKRVSEVDAIDQLLG